MIKLGFYGAAGEVTGSCYVLTTDRARVMIDMGMHQGEREAIEHNRRMPPIDPSSLDAVVLTHAPPGPLWAAAAADQERVPRTDPLHERNRRCHRHHPPGFRQDSGGRLLTLQPPASSR